MNELPISESRCRSNAFIKKLKLYTNTDYCSWSSASVLLRPKAHSRWTSRTDRIIAVWTCRPAARRTKEHWFEGRGC